MAPKKTQTYQRKGNSMSMAPSLWIIDKSKQSPNHYYSSKSEEGAQSSNDKNKESLPKSSSDLVTTLTSNATKTGEAYDPPYARDESIHLSTKPNRWCVRRMLKLFTDGLPMNE
ncbi:hypothetical protein H5410_046206 [Solanum commersonii]|uniref:Uncharacterized protein n=1 Tax=Solanum commersonii TaxID=4109 RepID=A0A9J5XEX1_SOLCO|nr:hypothetical protein H5410_046206 [Solanum commersonii]